MFFRPFQVRTRIFYFAQRQLSRAYAQADRRHIARIGGGLVLVFSLVKIFQCFSRGSAIEAQALAVESDKGR